MSLLHFILYFYCIGSLCFLIGSVLHIHNLNSQLNNEAKTKVENHSKLVHLTAKYPLPKGWIIADCGQSLLHYYWYILAVDADTYLRYKKNYRKVFLEEFDTFEDAYMAVREKALKESEEAKTVNVNRPVQLEFDFDFSPDEEFENRR